MQNITIYHREPPTEAIKGFQSALFGRQLSRALYELHTLGFGDEELHQALKRAMNACLALDLPIEQHFRCTYVCHRQAVVPSWKLSETAFRLVLLNANPIHPEVAQFQIKLIEKLR
ncbi:MAG: hypothetical protein AAGE93_02320 [Bacteroidota bacterium]